MTTLCRKESILTEAVELTFEEMPITLLIDSAKEKESVMDAGVPGTDELPYPGTGNA